MNRILVALTLGAMLSGCAASGTGSGARGPRNVLSHEEIATINVATAYDAVQQLRPEYLRTRGTISVQSPNPEYAVVYINGVRAGGLDALQRIRASDVQDMRYLSASEATTRYGTGHAGGVIEVRTRT